MQQQDQSEQVEINTDKKSISGQANSGEDTKQMTAENASSENEQRHPGTFDWPALIAALAVAAFFTLTARFNSQPSPSYIPAAVFSATGCGLLVTAIHKLRARTGAGLLEAGLSGFGMALFQFAMTFTYPGVFTTITTIPDYSRAFLLTWGLIALFAVVLSLAGATIGHLAFAPLRPLPVHTQKRDETDDDDDEVETDASRQMTASQTAEENARQERQTDEMNTTADDEAEDSPTPNDHAAHTDVTADDADEDALMVAAVAQPQRSLLNYTITILLLGLLPMMAGYVFAATYDFIMNAINVTTISPALYPTLSLLSGLLPWRLAAPITLNNANGAFIVFTLLWRIPDSVLGNPSLFDVQALETLVFNAVGLAFLLITMYGSTQDQKRQSAPWNVFLLLEALFGLILILPANLWLLRGLEGVLQMQNLVTALPTIQLLNPTLFTLNLVTGVLFCPIIGIITRRQYQLWTAPRAKRTVSDEDLA